MCSDLIDADLQWDTDRMSDVTDGWTTVATRGVPIDNVNNILIGP